MSVGERAQAFAILKFLEKRVEARLQQLRDPLLADAQRRGEVVIGTDGKPTGSKKLYVEGTRVYDKKSVGKEPDYQKMTDLLNSKGIGVDKAYDQVQTWVYNPSKVSKLIDTGHLKLVEVDSLKKVVHALVVEPSTELAALLEGAAKALP
jgi:hypothetical protein